MAEKLLRGHHIKNLSIALNLGYLSPVNRRTLSYIIDGSPQDTIKIVADEEDGACKYCQKHEPKNYKECQNTALESLDGILADIWGFNIGESYKAEELIAKLSSARVFLRGTIKTIAYLFASGTTFT